MKREQSLAGVYDLINRMTTKQINELSAVVSTAVLAYEFGSEFLPVFQAAKNKRSSGILREFYAGISQITIEDIDELSRILSLPLDSELEKSPVAGLLQVPAGVTYG